MRLYWRFWITWIAALSHVLIVAQSTSGRDVAVNVVASGWCVMCFADELLNNWRFILMQYSLLLSIHADSIEYRDMIGNCIDFIHLSFEYRWVDTNPSVYEWLRSNTNDAWRQQKVLGAILLESGPSRRRRSTVLQTAGLCIYHHCVPCGLCGVRISSLCFPATCHKRQPIVSL